MKKLLREDSGSVTIEATISLSAFMFTIVTILTIVNICLVQSRVGVAIHATAKELSHYSYLYSITGLPESKAKLDEAAKKHEGDVDGVLKDCNTIYTEIQNLGKKDGEKESAQDITGMIDSLKQSYDNVSQAGGSLKQSLEKMAEDPKSVALGLAAIAASDGWDLATSRLIAAPLSKGLCKKNLVGEKNGDVESYLRQLGVVPAANGSYLDGLDFSLSSIFPGQSNEIRVCVSYDVKVIALLPIDFSFHFEQQAITHGWLTGNQSYRTPQKQIEQYESENSSIWLDATITERVDLIRHNGIKDYEDEGYNQVCGRSFQDVHAYNSETNEFLVINTMNPLYSAPGEPTLTLDDISEQAIRETIEHLCAGISDTAKNMKTVETKKTLPNGKVVTNSYSCTGNKQRLVLVIPEDEGLDGKLLAIINSCDKRGVTVELHQGYGLGARTSTVTSEEGGGS